MVSPQLFMPKKLMVKFSEAELNTLYDLVADRIESGVYSGNQAQYEKRLQGIFKQLVQVLISVQ